MAPKRGSEPAGMTPVSENGKLPPVGKLVAYDEELERPLTWAEGVLGGATLTLLGGWLHTLSLLFVLAVVWRSAVAGAALALLFGSLLLPPGRLRWEAFLDSWVFMSWRRYFRFRALFTAPIDPEEHYILCEFPHVRPPPRRAPAARTSRRTQAVVPFGQFLAATVAPRMFPNMHVYGCASTRPRRAAAAPAHARARAASRPATCSASLSSATS